MKKYLLILCSFIILASMPLTIARAQEIEIPEETLEVVPREDFIELISYEARWRGGEAIAKVEALNELVASLRTQIESYGVDVDIPDFSGLALELRAKLDAVGQAATVADAKARIQDFKNAAYSAEAEVRSRLNESLRDVIEPALMAKVDDIKAEVDARLRAEGAKLGEEAKARLTAQAMAEAEAAKNELKARLQAEIEAEIRAQYGGQKDLDVNFLMELGLKIGMERGAQEAEKIRAEIQARYEQMAEQERQWVTAEMERRAETLAAEEKSKVEAIRDGFVSLEVDMLRLAQDKMAEWEKYQKQALDKKRSIFKSIIDDKTAYAIEMMEANRELIEEARLSGRLGDYNLPTTDELLSEFENDKQALIEQLMQAENNTEINAAVDRFKNSWEDVRESLEMASLQGAQEIIDVMKTRLQESQVESILRDAIKEINKKISKLGNERARGKMTPEMERQLEKLKLLLLEIEEALEIIDRVNRARSTDGIVSLLALRDRLQEKLNRIKKCLALGVPEAPVVTNGMGAYRVSAEAAMLNGAVTGRGGERPTLVAYWGTRDGGTNAAAWENEVNLVNCNAHITGMTPATRYYYRCFAYNSWGSDWADETESFNTRIPRLIGKIAFVSHGRYSANGIHIMNADGTNRTPLTDQFAQYTYPALSPDGTRVAFVSDRDGQWSIHVIDADGSNLTRLVEKQCATYPRWSPDGNKIAFSDIRRSVYIVDTDGSNLTRLADSGEHPNWSPDGARIAFVGRMPEARYQADIYVMNADGGNVIRVTDNSMMERNLVWSPDGAKFAFNDIRGGIYVVDADGSNLTRLAVSGEYPAWSPDSARIVFQDFVDFGDIFVINPDGSNLLRINHPRDARYHPYGYTVMMPSWSVGSVPPPPMPKDYSFWDWSNPPE